MSRVLQELGGPISCRETERHDVGLGVPLGVLHLHESQERRATGHGDGDRIEDLDPLDTAGLSPEPPPRLEERRQHLLEIRLPAPTEQVLPARLDRDLRQRPIRASRLLLERGRSALLEGEPVLRVRRQRQQVGELPDPGKVRLAEQLHRHHLAELREIQLHELGVPREVGHDQDPLVFVAADEREHLGVRGMEELEAAPPEGTEALAKRHQPLHPPQEGVGVVQLGFDVHRLVGEVRVDDRRKEEPLGVRPREAGVAVRAPLHRRPDSVAVPEIDVVSHPDLVAVVHDRGPRQREEQRVHELDPAAVVSQERSEASADPEVDASLRLLGVDPVHVVPLFVRHHLERQLVVVSQEDRPLRGVRSRGCLVEDVDDRVAVLHPQRHEHPGHEGEVEGHVALVPFSFAEIGHGVFGPLVGLPQQHPRRVLPIHVGPKLLQHLVRLRQVLAGRALPLHQVRDGVEPKPVHAHVEPEVHHLQHRLQHGGVVVVEVGLVGVEAVPVVGLRGLVPRPVRGLELLEDNARVAVAIDGLAPDVEIAEGAPGPGAPRPTEPGVLVGGVVHDELCDDP